MVDAYTETISILNSRILELISGTGPLLPLKYQTPTLSISDSLLPCSPIMMCAMVRSFLHRQIRPANVMVRSKRCIALVLRHRMLLLKTLITLPRGSRAFRRHGILERLSDPMQDRSMSLIWAREYTVKYSRYVITCVPL